MLKKYGFFGFLKICLSVLRSKFLNPRIRLIRQPFSIRNRRNVVFGKNFTSGINLRIDTPDCHKKTLFFGNNIEVNDFCHFSAYSNVTIGDNVLIASKVQQGVYKSYGMSPRLIQCVVASIPLVEYFEFPFL